MTTTLNIDGYIANVTIDFDSGILHGEVVNTRDVLTFSAKSVDDLRAAFADTLADYREWCAEEGVEPEKPYSGSLTLRLSPRVHRLAATRAASEGVSLASWLVKTIECELGERPAAITSTQMHRRIVQVQEDFIRGITSRTVLGEDKEEPWAEKASRLQ